MTVRSGRRRRPAVVVAAALLAATLAVGAPAAAGPPGALENPPPYVLEWGDRDAFGYVPAMAVDGDGQVFVADESEARIQVFDAEGRFLRAWGEEGAGDGQFELPRGVAVDEAGTVYVHDGGRVQRFTSDGAFLGAWQSDGFGAIAVDAVGHVLVADPARAQVLEYDVGGGLLATIPAGGPEDGSFPSAVAVDANGDVYVAGSHAVVRRLARDGTVLAAWGEVGSGPGQLRWPTSLAVGPDNRVYVTDSGNDRIQAFSPDGGLVTHWGTPGRTGPGRFNEPTAVAAADDGSVYVADWSYRIQKFGRVPQPDARIRGGTTGRAVGDGVYDPNARGETLIDTAAGGTSLRYTVTVENDAPVPDRVALRGTVATGDFAVRYRAGGADVTAAVGAGTFRTARLDPGEAATVVATVEVAAGAAAGATLEGRVAAVSTVDASRGDAVGFLARVCAGTCAAPPVVPPPTVYATVQDHSYDGRLVPIDTATGTVGPGAVVGWLPNDVAVAPDGRTAYVAVYADDVVRVVDLVSGRAEDSIPVGNGPWSVAVSPDGAAVLVVNTESASATPIDAVSRTARQPFHVGRDPFGLAIAPDGRTAYVAVGAGVVPVDLDTRRIRAVIPVADARNLAITPDGATALVTGREGLTPIDLAAEEAEAPIPLGATQDVAITPDGATAYVTRAYGDDDVTPIDVATRTPGARIPLPGFPDQLVITPDGLDAYVVVSSVPGLRDDAVVPIDLATEAVGTPIPVGPDIGGIAVTPLPMAAAPPAPVAAAPRFTG